MKKLAAFAGISVLCVLSLLIIPHIGAYAYTIVGVCVGAMSVATLAILTLQEHAPWWAVALASIGGGFLAGLFWPAALLSGFIYLNLSDPADLTSSSTDSRSCQTGGPCVEDTQQCKHADQS